MGGPVDAGRAIHQPPAPALVMAGGDGEARDG